MIGRLTTAMFSDATGSIIDTHSAVKVLAIAITAEIVAAAMIVIAKDKVVELIQENGVNVLFYGAAFFFFNGFFIAFAIYRLLANKWPHRGGRILIWLVSVIAGAINILLGFVILAFEPR